MGRETILTDTDILIDYLRGQDESLKEQLELYQVSISAVSLFELYHGFFRGAEHSEQELKDLLEVTQLLPFEDKAAKLSGQIKADLQQKGNVIEIRDIFIAATALVNDLRLATRNKKHFQRVPGLELVDL